VHAKERSLPARLPVQYVIRPRNTDHHDFRGYAGRLKTGTLQKGKKVVVLPSLKESLIKSVSVADKQVDKAFAGESVVIELEEDVDVSRGNMIVDPATKYNHVNTITATLSWMEEQPVVAGKSFLLQHNTNRVKAKLIQLQSVLDIETMEEKTDVSQLKLNDIGRVIIKTAKPIFADTYQSNPDNGSFILSDEFSNNTVAVGFIDSF
jgi:sulfate adenylyltransferase subunit 1